MFILFAIVAVVRRTDEISLYALKLDLAVSVCVLYAFVYGRFAFWVRWDLKIGYVR